MAKKQKLEDNLESCEKKLVRAEQLIGGLGGEKTRWTSIWYALIIICFLSLGKTYIRLPSG